MEADYPDYFTFFNILMPLYDRGSFEALIDKQYSDDPPRKASWYCAFNMVLAVACRLRITHGDQNASTHNLEQSRFYYRNAVSVLLQVMMTSSDLMAIQAMLCMVGITRRLQEESLTGIGSLRPRKLESPHWLHAPRNSCPPFLDNWDAPQRNLLPVGPC